LGSVFTGKSDILAELTSRGMGEVALGPHDAEEKERARKRAAKKAAKLQQKQEAEKRMASC
jgi:hypothetical protein